MSRKTDIQRELLAYTHLRLGVSRHAGKDSSTQLLYQMGILIGMLSELADSDSHTYKQLLYKIHPELRPGTKPR